MSIFDEELAAVYAKSLRTGLAYYESSLEDIVAIRMNPNVYNVLKVNIEHDDGFNNTGKFPMYFGIPIWITSEVGIFDFFMKEQADSMVALWGRSGWQPKTPRS